MSKPKLLIDFETRSKEPITRGLRRYLHETADPDIILLGYKASHHREAQLWWPGLPIPDEIKCANDFSTYAFNTGFDWRVWNVLGTMYGYPHLELKNTVDVMALCGRYGLPQSLDMAGATLKTATQKQPYGKALIKKICCPPFKYTPQDMDLFKTYCKDDVETMHGIMRALPTDKLSKNEQRIWQETVYQNGKGVPVDRKEIAQIHKVTKSYHEAQVETLPDLTNGLVTTIGQVAKIKEFCGLPNLQAETVTKALTRPEDFTEEQVSVLEMRQAIGLSSTAKYTKLLELECDGVVGDNLRYFGGHTGRFAGMGFQLHNLPRASVDDPEAEIKKYYDYSILDENPVQSAKALIRSMIKAPEGRVLAMADYSSIEYILLCWQAGDHVAVQRFLDGYDQYIDMASFLFKVPYGDVTKDQRQIAKAVVLGGIYGLGWKGFGGYAEGYGLNLTDLQCQEAIGAFRFKYKKIKSFWYDSKDTMVSAVLNPGFEYKFGKCKYKYMLDRNGKSWLRLMLPSGRGIFYSEPQIKEDTYGPLVTHMGQNPYTRVWSRLKLIPGRITENIIQAGARDLMANGMLNLVDKGYDVRFHVHDEIVSLVPDTFNDDDMKEYCDTMCILPDWAEGLPLKAEGEYGKRYKKM